MTFMYAPTDRWLVLCLEGWIPMDTWLYHHARWSILMRRAGA